MGKVNVNTETKMVAKKSKTAKFSDELRKNGPLFLMLLPGVVLVTIFAYLPLFGVVLAFERYNMRDRFFSPFIGLQNFEFLFKDAMYMITRNTLVYNVIFIVFGLILAVGFAVALNELRSKVCKKVYQTIIMLPHFLSWVIVAYLVLAFLNPEFGLVNTAFVPKGQVMTDWYTKIDMWPYLLVFLHFWKSVGYSSIVYFAAIAGIDQEMYEAAVIDGASKWQQIKHITIPSLYPLMIILSTLAVGKIFNADFGLFYQVPMDSGQLYPVTQVIDTYVYRMLRSAGANTLGMAAAAGFYQSVCGFILVYTTNMIVRKIDPEKSLF